MKKSLWNCLFDELENHSETNEKNMKAAIAYAVLNGFISRYTFEQIYCCWKIKSEAENDSAKKYIRSLLIENLIGFFRLCDEDELKTYLEKMFIDQEYFVFDDFLINALPNAYLIDKRYLYFLDYSDNRLKLADLKNTKDVYDDDYEDDPDTGVNVCLDFFSNDIGNYRLPLMEIVDISEDTIDEKYNQDTQRPPKDVDAYVLFKPKNNEKEYSVNVTDLLECIGGYSDRVYFNNLREKTIKPCLVPESEIVVDLYDKILGFNEARRCLLLKSSADNHFVEVSVDDKNISVLHRNYIGVIDSIHYVYIEDGKIYADGFDDGAHFVADASIYKKYEARDDRIVVRNIERKPGFEKEYFLNIDGEVSYPHYSVNAQFLFGFLISRLRISSPIYRFRSDLNLHKNFYDEKLTIAEVNRIARRLNFEDKVPAKSVLWLMHIFSKYMPEDADVMDYLFTLIDVSQIIENNNQVLISSKVIGFIKELDDSKQLEAKLKNVEIFNSLFIDVWKYKNAREEVEKKSKLTPLVGSFNLDGNTFVSDKIRKDDGVKIGDVIMHFHCGVNMPGIVVFDTRENIYHVQYYRKFSDDEINKIVSEFQLGNCCVDYFIESRLNS